MYYRHFRLTGPPFEAVTGSETVYLSRAHRESLAALEWGLLYEPSGFTTLTGETGTGKTTLVCSILARNFEQLCAAYVINPKLSFEDILRVVLGQFGIQCSGSTKLDRIEALAAFLARRTPQERLAIIVDEAQDLSDDVLEELRLLSNYGQRLGRYLQLVLVGQPELAVRLRNPSLRQFNQRVAARSVLSRLSFAEANEYVEYRLRAKGGRSKDLFDTAALTYLLRHSGGLPRKINVLCHNAMLLAYSSGKQQVDLKATRAAVAEHGEPLLGGLAALSTSAASKQPALVGIAALGLLLFTGYLYRGNPTGAVQPGISVPPAVASESRTSAKTIADKIVASFSPLHVARHVEQTNQENPAVENRPQATRRASAISAIDNAPQTAQPGITGPLVLPDLSPTDLPLDHSQSAMEHPKSAIEHEANSASQADRGSISSVSSTAVRHRSVLVKYGDTLERLAIRYLGSRYALGAIEDANPQIADVNKIYPGQKVYLSATDTSHANTDTGTEPADRVAYKH